MGGPSETEAPADAAGRATREAATWFARLLDERAPASDYASFRAWLQADERNAEAYARIERLWTEAAAEPPRTGAGATRRRLLKTASSLILLSGAGGTVWTLARQPDFSTRTGEIRTVSLPDGSRVELAAASAISINFTSASRRVVLHAGEAFFSVSPDAARPFVVEAGGLSATALGTAYAVAVAPGRTSVAVAEHAVRVEADGRSVDLSEGDAIDWENGALGDVAGGEAENRLGWRSRQLVFLARPLGEIVAEINRWRDGRLVLLDPQLSQRRVTAILDLRDMAEIDRTLQQGLPLVLTDYTPLLTLVTAGK